MAEFTKIMRQWKRMCRAYQKCDKCPLVNLECYNRPPACWNYHSDGVIENIIMAWAAENPEPVYPTWREWLADRHFDELDQMSPLDDVKQITISLDSHISHDAAIRLGVKPKEAKHG